MNSDLALVFMMVSHSSSLVSRMVLEMIAPALLTRQSIPPSVFSACAQMSST